MTSRWSWLMAAAVLVTVSLNLTSLETYPPPQCDETSYGGSAVSWLRRGTFGWAAFSQGDYLGRDVDVMRLGRGYVIGMAAMFRAFGATLPVGRLYSVLGWLGAGCLTFLVGSALGDRRAGAVAALAFLSSTKALLTSHLVRPEAWLVCAELIALLAILLALRAGSAVPPFLAGLTAVLPAEFHGHGFAFLLGFIAVFCWAELVRRRPAVAARYLAGVGTGLLLWIGWRYLGSAEAVRAQLHEAMRFTAFGRPQLAESQAVLVNLGTIPPFLRAAYWNLGGPGALLEAGIGLLGLAAAFKQLRPERGLVAIYTLVSFVAFSILFSQRFVQYAVAWTPLLYLLGFMAIHDVRGRRRGPRGRALLGVVGACVLFIHWADMGWLSIRYREVNFTAMSAALRRMVPPSERVLADPVWWWALKDTHTFIPDEYLLYPVPGDGRTTGDAEGRVDAYLRWLRPRYLVLDGAVSCLDHGGPGLDELARRTRGSCQKVGEIDGPWVGRDREREGIMGQRTTVFLCDLGPAEGRTGGEADR